MDRRFAVAVRRAAESLDVDAGLAERVGVREEHAGLVLEREDEILGLLHLVSPPRRLAEAPQHGAARRGSEAVRPALPSGRATRGTVDDVDEVRETRQC